LKHKLPATPLAAAAHTVATVTVVETLGALAAQVPPAGQERWQVGVGQWPSPLTHGTCLMTHPTCLMRHLPVTCLGRLVRYLYLAHWQVQRRAVPDPCQWCHFPGLCRGRDQSQAKSQAHERAHLLARCLSLPRLALPLTEAASCFPAKSILVLLRPVSRPSSALVCQLATLSMLPRCQTHELQRALG